MRRESLAVRATDAVNRPRLREIIRKNRRRGMSGLAWDVVERVRGRSAIRRRRGLKQWPKAASRSRLWADIARMGRERDALITQLRAAVVA